MTPRATILISALLAFGVWCAAAAWLLVQPQIDINNGRGLYLREGGARPFRWTATEARLPLLPRAGPTQVHVTLGRYPWDGTESVRARLGGRLWSVEATVGPEPRRYMLLLPSTDDMAVIQAPAARPATDWRWLGVQLYAAEARATGAPVPFLVRALIPALATFPLWFAGIWLTARGYGLPLALFGVAAGLRLAWMGDSPPGMHRDEMVSVVDAWHVLTTGRDHYGHALPLAAFEAFGDWISPLLAYLEIPAVALLGPGLPAARGTTALLGALAAPLVYAIGRELNLPRAAAFTGGLVAALSPWQIFLGRIAIPPSLVPAFWSMCLLAGVRLVTRGERRDALWLALAAGLALYAYPPMKLGVPLLAASAAALALFSRPFRATLVAWWPAAALLSALWLPFALDTLFNADSSRRLAQIALRADTTGEWLAKLWANYSVYFGADFWYLSGGLAKAIQGIPGRPMALPIEAPFALLGLLALLGAASGRFHPGETAAIERRAPAMAWILILVALLIAPFPGSLTERHPNAYRAAALAPMYAVVIMAGVAALWHLLARGLRGRGGAAARGLALAALCGIMVWQSAAWYRELLSGYPRIVASTWFFADRAIEEAMRLAVDEAPGFDEVWFDTDSVGRPYIYLLAARPMPAAEAQALMIVRREPPEPNFVDAIGMYHFANLETLPYDLPALHAVVDRFAAGGYLLQELRDGERRILVVRGMNTRAADAPVDQ